MLFTKKIEPSCSYCQRGKVMDGDSVLCKKRGVTPADSSCSAFQYDPLKRIPPRPKLPNFSKLRDEDFVL